MEDKFEKRNMIFVLKRFAMNVILQICFLFVVYDVLHGMMTEIISFDNKIFRNIAIILILVLIVKTVMHYKGLLTHLNRSSVITQIKNRGKGAPWRKSPKVQLYQMFMMYAEILERNKTKIDILKSFVPIPVVIFFLGFLMNSDTNIVSSYISLAFENIKNMNLNIKEKIFLGILVSVFYYCYQFIKTWFDYKATLRAYYSYKYEYDIIENENQSDNRIEDLIKDSTDKQLYQ